MATKKRKSRKKDSNNVVGGGTFPLVTMEDISWRIVYAGLEGAMDYFNPNHIGEADKELAKKWKRAQKLIEEIKQYVDERVPFDTFSD